MSKTKTATITSAMALTIMCDACDTACVEYHGSVMITPDSETVSCETCGTVYEMPRLAFQVVCKAKCKSQQ